MPEVKKLSTEAAGFYKRAAPWFAKKADKAVLRSGSTQFHAGVEGLYNYGVSTADAAPHDLGQADLDQSMIDTAQAELNGIIQAWPT